MRLRTLLAAVRAGAAAAALTLVSLRRGPGRLRRDRGRAALGLAVREHDPGAFRRSLETAGFLRPGAPPSTEAIVEHLAVFYDTIREPGPVTITSDYASSVVRRFFDLRGPVAGYISVPPPYVILQRINLGLFAVLSELSATADWRAISEEIWPFVRGPASTPLGEAEVAWQARRRALSPTAG